MEVVSCYVIKHLEGLESSPLNYAWGSSPPVFLVTQSLHGDLLPSSKPGEISGSLHQGKELCVYLRFAEETKWASRKGVSLDVAEKSRSSETRLGNHFASWMLATPCA